MKFVVTCGEETKFIGDMQDAINYVVDRVGREPDKVQGDWISPKFIWVTKPEWRIEEKNS